MNDKKTKSHQSCRKMLCTIRESTKRNKNWLENVLPEQLKGLLAAEHWEDMVKKTKASKESKHAEFIFSAVEWTMMNEQAWLVDW